jgi:uncharacterized membrane protein YphA (DoxX/SURF4 family)
VVLLHLRPFLADAFDGRIYADAFWQPFTAWYPELPRTAYVALLWVTAAAALALSAGLFTRAAAVVTFGGVAYNLFLSQTHFHHNRAFLVILLAGLAILPVGRWGSLDALRARPRGAVPAPAPLWPLGLLRFEVAAAYWASGLSKLLDGDWWNGLVTRLRIEQYGDLAASRGVPDWALEIAGSAGFHWWFAKLVVLTELAIGLGLLWRRSRLVSVWLAIGFHLAIEVFADVQVFSLAGLAALVIWVTPRSGDRILTVRSGDRGARRLAAAVRWLDWTGRFTITTAGGPGRAAVTLVDRPAADGTPVIRTGRPAVVMVLRRLPATFWVAALIPARTDRGEPSRPADGARAPASVGSPGG